jgi:hypothetical protein
MSLDGEYDFVTVAPEYVGRRSLIGYCPGTDAAGKD